MGHPPVPHRPHDLTRSPKAGADNPKPRAELLPAPRSAAYFSISLRGPLFYRQTGSPVGCGQRKRGRGNAKFACGRFGSHRLLPDSRSRTKFIVHCAQIAFQQPKRYRAMAGAVSSATGAPTDAESDATWDSFIMRGWSSSATARSSQSDGKLRRHVRCRRESTREIV